MDSGQIRKVPTNVVDFVGHETQGNVLYTTDERGRVRTNSLSKAFCNLGEC